MGLRHVSLGLYALTDAIPNARGIIMRSPLLSPSGNPDFSLLDKTNTKLSVFSMPFPTNHSPYSLCPSCFLNVQRR